MISSGVIAVDVVSRCELLVSCDRTNSTFGGGWGEGFREYVSIFKPIFFTFYPLLKVPFCGMIFGNFTPIKLYTK